LVPTVLRKDGFEFRIYNNDHEPMHSHIWKAGKEVVINLGDAASKPYIRESRGMTKTDERRALRIAALYQDFLIEEWTRINGDE
jgi:hypothetical protein